MYKNLFKNKGLSFDRLYSFCLVASAGGFNKAAGENPYKQSQYSKQISDLEKFFGCPLFYRKGKTIALTPQGKELFNLCISFFSQLEIFKSSKQGKKSKLVVSAGQSVIDFILSVIIDEDILELTESISYEAKSTDECIEDISDYHSHFAIVGKNVKQKDIASIKVLSSPTVIIYRKENNALFYFGNDRKKLAQNPTAILSGSGEYKSSLLKLFLKSKPNIVLEAPTFFALKSYVINGKAIAYIPEYCLTEYDKMKLSVISLPFLSTVKRDLYLIYRKNVIDRSKALSDLIKIFISKIQQLQ
jgi:DNA-binding transcriptional LysR family regulator